MTDKNFIWLVFDSIRGDRTSIGGHDRETTPTLEAIGAEPDGIAGTCFAHAIWSQPSVASMMTGTYPSMHGSGSYNEVLPAEIPTVAQRLSDGGYHTIGVSSNPYFSATTGTDRGFDRFDFVSGTELVREAGVTSLLSFLRHLRTFSGGLAPDKQKHTPDFLLNQIVKDRLRSSVDREEPIFLAAHYYGAHHPYYPSPVFREEFASELPTSPAEAARSAFAQSTNVYEQIAGGLEDEADREVMRTMYDAQVRQVDALVSRLVAFLEEIEIADETILVITADHGDLLGELDLVSHKLLLHDALIEVPLAVLGSKRLREADLQLAQHADVMATILAELGIETDGMHGKLLDRTSRELAVAQRGDETYRKTISEIRKYDAEFDHEHAFGGFVTAGRSEDWKYVSGEDEDALYRLPAEETDVKSEYPTIADRLAKRLGQWQHRHGGRIDSSDNAEFTDNIKQRLADLGYVVD